MQPDAIRRVIHPPPRMPVRPRARRVPPGVRNPLREGAAPFAVGPERIYHPRREAGYESGRRSYSRHSTTAAGRETTGLIVCGYQLSGRRHGGLAELFTRAIDALKAAARRRAAA